MRFIKVLGVVVISALLLASCATAEQSADEIALEIRTDFLKAERLEISADITADYGDRVYEFTIKYAGDAKEGVLSILSPEQVAGITAEVTVSGCTLIYDGARMDTGALTAGGLSPAEAIPALITQWQSGYIESSGSERLGDMDTAAIVTSMEGGASQKTWFDVTTRLPVRAELYDSGVMVVACVFNDIVLE